MADPGSKKTHSGRHNADAALVVALAGGATVRAAAEQLGISERTVARRLADPVFREQVRQARADLVVEAAGRLAGKLTSAVNTLADLLGEEDARVRLQAAARLLEIGLKANREEGPDLVGRLSVTATVPVRAEEFSEEQRWAAILELQARFSDTQTPPIDASEE